MKAIGLIAIFNLLFLPAAYCQQKMASPHEKAAIETGVITGTLLKDKKIPLDGYPVTLEILKGDELLLTISKRTDEKGRYQFRNIFQSPEFRYAISAEYDDITYRTDFVSLAKGEKMRKLNLLVGEGAKEGPPLPTQAAAIVGREEGTGGMQKKIAANEYKLLAVLLSIAAVGYGLYRRNRRNPAT